MNTVTTHLPKYFYLAFTIAITPVAAAAANNNNPGETHSYSITQWGIWETGVSPSANGQQQALEVRPSKVNLRINSIYALSPRNATSRQRNNSPVGNSPVGGPANNLI